MKWNEPLGPVPSFLDSTLEVTSNPPKRSRGDGVIDSIQSLLILGVPPLQALGVTANSVNESGWFEFDRGCNLGGWKIWEFSSKYANGASRPWFRAPGNKAPGATLTDYKGGDPPWCYYRVFPSYRHYYREWLMTFVPRVNPGARPNGRYWKTGQQFWAGEPWFDDLCDAGYKGERTQNAPEGSIREHDAIITELVEYWAQYVLGVPVDGAWGKGSKAALAAFEKRCGLPETGLLSPRNRRLLLGF